MISRPPILRAILGLLGGVFFAAVLLEGFAATAFFFKERRVFPYKQPYAAPISDPYQTRLVIFHPYFGYVNSPSRRDPGQSANNLGFQVNAERYAQNPDFYDYPRARRPGEFLVGIFGGSVAFGFATQAQGDAEMQAAFRSLPLAKSRTPVFLNFGLSGYRQPMQLLVLSYFLSIGQPLDLVLNLDGFNETVNSVMNENAGFESSYPPHHVWRALGEECQAGVPRKTDYLALLSASYHESQSESLRRQAVNRRLATFYFWDQAQAGWHAAKGASLRRDLRDQPVSSATDYFPIPPPFRTKSGVSLADYTAELWASSSRSMDRLARDRGAAYLHVLQPSQWFAPNGPYKPLTANPPFAWVQGPVNDFYPRFLAQIGPLRASGVRVLDASCLMKGEPAAKIWADDVCHLTPEGNRILARFIVREAAGPR